MPDKSGPRVGHATKRRRTIELDDDDDDCQIIAVKPAKRARTDSFSISWGLNNLFKKIGDWFKKKHRTNTHLFGVPAESNSAEEAIAHGGQYLEEASKDKFMPRHGTNGNGSSKSSYMPSHSVQPNPSGPSHQQSLTRGAYVNGDTTYGESSKDTPPMKSKYRTSSYTKASASRAKDTNTQSMCTAPNNSSMYSFPHANTNPVHKYKTGAPSSYVHSHDISGATEHMNGSLQKTYIEEAVKQRRASSRRSVYDNCYSDAESPPLFNTSQQHSRTRGVSAGFDLEEKERYKTLLKQYALRVDHKSQPQPTFNTQSLSLSRLSTYPGASLPPFSELLREEASEHLSAPDVSSISTVNDDALTFPSVGLSNQSQSTPLRSRLASARRAATRSNKSTEPSQQSELAVRCSQLADRMQVLKERSVSRLAKSQEIKALELQLTEWDRLRSEEDKHLEQMVQQRLKLSAKVILEDLPPPEIDEFPALSEEAEMAVEKAWQRGPSNVVLSQAFRLKISKGDIMTVYAQQWLNDEIVNFYFNLIQERGGKDDLPSVYVFNTFFYPKIMKEGHKGVRRWTKQVDIFSKDLILIPIHLGMHWCLACINLRDKIIQYFDSMGGRNNDCLEALRRYLEDESLDKKKQAFDTSGWVLENVRDIPHQMNGSDCGVFSCKYAEYLSRDAPFTFSQEHMPYFRKRMVYEILTKKLL